MSHETLEYVRGDFVFRLQASQSGYDSHVQIFTRRHYDNCLANQTMPWAFTEIKVKADNGEFVAFDPEYSQFVDFCEMWITNPHLTEKKSRAEIRDAESEDWDRKVTNHIAQTKEIALNDFPYVAHTSRILDI